MAFFPDRFIRKADPDHFRLKTLLDQQQAFECRNTDIDALFSKRGSASYEDVLTSVFYNTSSDGLVHRSVFGTPSAERQIQPIHFREPSKIYRSPVKSSDSFHMVRVLAAPGIAADFYSSPLSCHPTIPSLFALALSSSVYLRNYSDGQPNEICDFSEDPRMRPTTVKWITNEMLGIGTNNGAFQCYDMTQDRLFRKIYTHSGQHPDCRVSAIALRGAQGLFVSNHSSDLLNIDLRASHPIRMILNIGSICNIACREEILLAGGNDNVVRVYDTRHMVAADPLFSHVHKAGVRALSFLPGNNNVFITGGGLGDKRVRLFDLRRGKLLSQVNVHAQVSNLLALGGNVCISTQGFGGQLANSVIQWQYQESALAPQKILPQKVLGTLRGRIFYADKCADEGNQERFLTVSEDEALRVWEQKPEVKKNDDEKWLNKQIIR